MKTHLRTEEIEAVIVGCEIDDSRRTHFDSCVVCRAEAARLVDVIEARREELLADEPDWDAMTAAVLGRLPTADAAHASRRARWLRSMLAAAAALVVAIGLGWLRPDRTAPPPGDEVAVEEILAEMDELLADDGIPGFEIIDPESGDLETYFDNGAS